jgi:DNA-directed RNA polymerase subunit beta
MTVRGGVEVPVEVDDIDHFGNRRLRTVGELIQNQIRVGLSRMERVVRERMTTQDVEAITPQTLINIRPVVAAIRSSSEPRSCRSSWTRTTRCRV